MATRGSVAVVAIALVVALTAAWAAFSSGKSAQAESASAVHLRWVLPHPPEALFDEAKKILAADIKKDTGGTMVLADTFFPGELGVEPGDHNAMALLDEKKAEMVTDYVEHLGNHEEAFLSLTLPYLFDDYDSALRFLDGPEAKPLLDSLSRTTPYKALAFTMSGGFRLFVSKEKPIRTPDDLRGLHVLNAFGGLIVEATAKAFGYSSSFDIRSETNPTPELLEGFDAVETTYTRIDRLLNNVPSFAAYVTETEHAISLTAIVVTNEFFDSLSSTQQEALVKAAQRAAAVEKQASIAAEEPARERLRELGATIIFLSSEEEQAFKDAVQPVRKQYDGRFEPILQDIEASK